MASFKVRIRSVDGVSTTALVSEDTGQVVILAEHLELRLLEGEASAAASGPPLWLAPLQVLYDWADRVGATVTPDPRMLKLMDGWDPKAIY